MPELGDLVVTDTGDAFDGLSGLVVADKGDGDFVVLVLDPETRIVQELSFSGSELEGVS